MDSQDRSELAGLAEVASLLGLSKPATNRRSQADDFPEPIARLASGPVWRTEDVIAYARIRVSRFHERPGVERLAAEPPSGSDLLPVDEAAELLAVPVSRLRGVALNVPGMPGRFDSDGQLVAIRRSDLGLYARASGGRVVEIAGVLA